jgi:hypothetical protein
MLFYAFIFFFQSLEIGILSQDKSHAKEREYFTLY